MSNIEDELLKLKLPSDLPGCPCFASGDRLRAMSRCADVGGLCSALCHAFHLYTEEANLCKHALPYVVDTMLTCVLAYVAKAEGPALEYGSVEIEREVERLLTGLEARMLARNREIYARGRELGLTAESVRAMREKGTRQ